MKKKLTLAGLRQKTLTRFQSSLDVVQTKMHQIKLIVHADEMLTLQKVIFYFLSLFLEKMICFRDYVLNFVNSFSAEIRLLFSSA